MLSKISKAPWRMMFKYNISGENHPLSADELFKLWKFH